MKTALIGYSGFVGSNLAKNMKFTDYYNSKNIKDIKGKEYDLVISSGIRAEKYLANKYPERDLENIKKFLKELKALKKVNKIVLISTVDVYKSPFNVDEDSEIVEKDLKPYGKNRLYAEKYIQNNFKNFLIIRLPGLFGINLKKNFIYDMITKIPTMILKNKFENIIEKLDSKDKEILKNSYIKNEDENYVYLGKNKFEVLQILENLNFTSLNFTDFRSSFQFYNLENLKKDIEIALENKLKLLNISSEPLTAKELAKECFNFEMNNKLDQKSILKYNMKSKYYELYNGENGYLYNKNSVIYDIKKLIKNKGELI